MDSIEFSDSLTTVSSSEEEDDFNYSSDSSDDSETGEAYNLAKRRRKRALAATSVRVPLEARGPKNLFLKLRNREHTGCFSGNGRSRHLPPRAFNKVPNRLGFCLKDIVPHCFLQGHIFMGLSACGQFLLSYKVCCNDNIATNHYSFNIGYKYTLYFWMYQPHKPLRSFYKCCLFDDHGVDNLKDVTMTQWKCASADPRVLIVHGAAEDENEDSYITYVKVPKLGCLDCKKLRDLDEDSVFRWYALCLKCNLTIHTKYSSTESDQTFNPYMNLICPERILIMANGFVHMLHIDLEHASTTTTAPAPAILHAQQQQHQQQNMATNFHQLVALPRATPPHESLSSLAAVVEANGSCDNHNNIVARIIADFSDIETDSTHSSGSRSHFDAQRSQSVSVAAAAASACYNEVGGAASASACVSRKTYDELIFTCNGSSPNAAGSLGAAQVASGSSAGSSGVGGAVVVGSKSGTSTKVSLISHKGRRHHRIVTKSFRNGVTTVDLQGSPTTSAAATAAADKSNAYEFSEDNEKCEKISTLRKRRLADKKYEFSEDNSENIIPFTKIRSASRSSIGSARNLLQHRPSVVAGHSHSHHAHHSSSPCASPSSSPHPSHASSSAGGGDARHCTPPPLPVHRASPIASVSLQQGGFRSPPCSSPITNSGSSSVGGVGGGVFMRSPSRHVSAAQIYGQKSPPQPQLSLATQQMLSFKTLGGTLSPLQVSMAKRSHLELSGSMSPNTPFLSPRREELRVVEVPLQGAAMPEKPVCTKKFKRRYVEDDAASVITSEEDDCISPGYHTSLPMEVHGSCYSEMQMISQASYQHLRCTSVVVTQHSFDLDAFTYYAISSLCQKNHKTYDVFYDWACELISICPLSNTIICLLMAQFSARDQLPTSPTNCLNCSRKLDCAFHRRQFECRILFTWNMDSGVWEVLDNGELIECKPANYISPVKKCGVAAVSLVDTAKKLALEMATSLGKIQDYSSNLRVLDANPKRSKTCLTDHDNMIEFYLKRPRKNVANEADE